MALINHSCLPSVIVTYNGTSADVRAVRDMKPGDEVSKDHRCSWTCPGPNHICLVVWRQRQSKSLRKCATKTHGRLLILEIGLKFCKLAQIRRRGKITLVQQVLEAFKSKNEVKVNHLEVLENRVILSAAAAQQKLVFNRDNCFKILKSGLCASNCDALE